MGLTVDTRESSIVRKKFKSMSQDYEDLEIQFTALKTGDYEWEYGIIENKSLSDFVSSFTEKIYRKDGTKYNRLESQIERMLSIDKPIKILFIHGTIKDLHSSVHENSIYGMIGSILCRGINVFWIQDDKCNWPEQVYRIYKKSLKYCGEG